MLSKHKNWLILVVIVIYINIQHMYAQWVQRKESMLLGWLGVKGWTKVVKLWAFVRKF